MNPRRLISSQAYRDYRRIGSAARIDGQDMDVAIDGPGDGYAYLMLGPVIVRIQAIAFYIDQFQIIIRVGNDYIDAQGE